MRQGEGGSRLCCVSDEVDVCWERRHTLALFDNGASLAFAPLITLTVATLAVATLIVAVAHVLHLAVTINGAPRPVAVAAIIVALTAVVFAGRASTLTARRGAAAAGRPVATCWDAAVITARAAVATVAAALTTGAVTAGVEAP